ncbi:MAG: hypothetical protein ACD_72C00027G0003 [uncultured bacterium]|nr:MAG: hypothetical protein ACD_72C00027G0003 [uncultured bacterium]
MQKCVDERLAIFIDNPKDSILKDHGLIGDYLGYRSININGDWRAIYLETDKDEVIFEMLGTHSQLYK